MFNKKTFLLAAGYVFGSVVSSLYNKKKSEDLKKDLKKSKHDSKESARILWENFVETQKNLFKDVQDTTLSEKNKKLFEKRKKELFKVVDNYKKEGKELLAELKLQ
jgi:gas vesicle protein